MNFFASIAAGQVRNMIIAARTLRGNSRLILITTLMGWVIQFAYIGQYLPIYLTSPAIGVSKEFYGMLCAITALSAMVGGFLSGAIAARFRPKIVLLIGDTTTFAVASLLYAFGSAGRPVLLIAAALLSGGWGWHNSCFQLLLTKGQDKESLPRMYAFFQVTTMGVCLLTPLAGLLLAHFDLISLTRTMLFASAGLVLTFALIRLWLLDEYYPHPSAEKPRGTGIRKTFEIVMGEDRSLRTLITVIFLNGICGGARFSYGAIYFTDGLGVSKAAISILPAITSMVVIAATLFAVPHFSARRANLLLRTAFALFFLSDLALAYAPKGMLPWLVGTSVCAGLAGFLSMSLTNSTILNIASPVNWPYLVGINVPVFSLAGIIAGPVMGALYTHWFRLPFLVSACISLTCMAIVFRTDFSPRHSTVPAPAEATVPPS